MQGLDLSFDAIGTKWHITSAEELTKERLASLTQTIHHRIVQFDKHYSRFRRDSLVTKMSQRAGTYDLPTDGYALLQCYEQLYRASNGKVTPLIGQVIADLGYDAKYSFKIGKATPPPAWDDIIQYSEQHIILVKPALLDFGAAGKGYLIDIVSSLLAAAQLTDYMINAGGDILYKTAANNPLAVGLENPFDRTEIVGVVQLANQSICGSAGSRRAWGEYTHIIDPDKLATPQNVQASWVIADTAMLADGLATALFFTTPEKLSHSFRFSYAILRANMSLEYSRNFPVVVNEVAA